MMVSYKLQATSLGSDWTFPTAQQEKKPMRKVGPKGEFGEWGIQPER